MQQRRVAAREHALGLVAHERPEPVLAGSAVDQEAQQRPCLRDALTRVGELGGVEDEHVAQRLAQAPAGQGVVADVGHAARRRAPRGTPRAGDRARWPAPTSTRRARSRSRSRPPAARAPRSPAPRGSRSPGRARRRAPGRARSPSARRRCPRRSRRAARPPSARGCPRRRSRARGRGSARAPPGAGRRASPASRGDRDASGRTGAPDRGPRRTATRGRPGSAQNALLVLRSQPTRMGTTLPLAVCSR